MQKRTFLMKSYVRDGESFHFARKHLEATPPRIVHTHDYYECFWIEGGEGTHWINDRKTTLARGDMVFMRPWDTHGFQRRGRAPFRLVNISFFARTAEHLLERYGDELTHRFFWSKEDLPRAHRLDDAQIGMLMRLARELETGPRSLARIEGFLLGVMTRIFGSRDEPVGQLPGWLISACQAARDPEVFREGATGFVRAAGRSHEHVCRAARQYLQVTPSAYVNRIRMEHAARLLAGSDESISQIALECGLENLSHFYRMFRTHYALTPRAYRRRNQVDIVQPTS